MRQNVGPRELVDIIQNTPLNEAAIKSAADQVQREGDIAWPMIEALAGMRSRSESGAKRGVTGTVHWLPSVEALVGKRELAQTLGVSVRTVENRMAQGMPHVPPSPRFARCRFRVGECEAWLAAQTPRAKPAGLSLSARVAYLEDVVARLEERIAG